MTKVIHTLVAIGYLGIKRVYLDLSSSEAMSRYRKVEGLPDDELLEVKSFEFCDEFGAYDVWPEQPYYILDS